MANAQVAFEYLVFVAFGLFVLLLVLVPLHAYLGGRTEEATGEAVADFARAIQDELILAASVHPGLSTTYTIPDGQLATELAKMPYRLSNTNTTLTVSYARGDLVLPIPLTRGNLSNGTNLIRNVGGIVHVN